MRDTAYKCNNRKGAVQRPDFGRRWSPVLRLASFIRVFVMAAWLLFPPRASAHAQLVRSTPSAGALLDTPPQTMRLEFGESVSLDFTL